MSFIRFIASLSLALGILFLLSCSSVQETTNTYTKARPAADESATLMTLKTIATAQQTYFARTGALGTFSQLADSGALDGRFKGDKPVVNGYAFTMNLTTLPTDKQAAYSVQADPQPTANRQTTGTRHYFMDSSGVIHYNDSQPATASDPTSQ